MNQSFWKSKKVFVTGHTGFKGSWLCLLLHSLNAEVSGYALEPNSRPSLFDLASVSRFLEHSIISDIRDPAALSLAMDRCQPEIIFHLAAQPLVRHSYQNPVETYEINILGTLHLLEALRYSKTAKVLVNITSDKCYKNTGQHEGYKEEDPLGGTDPYSSSKACAELITTAYRESFFNEAANKQIATARAGNVIGGGDWAADRLIPDIISAFINQQAPIIRNPQAVRPWQHVLDPLWGYLMLAEEMWHNPKQFAESWNFGPHNKDSKSVRTIVDKLSGFWGCSTDFKHLSENKFPETPFLKLNTTKANTKLGWYPRWNIDQALSLTVSWYKEWVAGGDALASTLNQIALYTHQRENINA